MTGKGRNVKVTKRACACLSMNETNTGTYDSPWKMEKVKPKSIYLFMNQGFCALSPLHSPRN